MSWIPFCPKYLVYDFVHLLSILNSFKEISFHIVSKVSIHKIWSYDYFIGLLLFNFIDKYQPQNKLKKNTLKKILLL